MRFTILWLQVRHQPMPATIAPRGQLRSHPAPAAWRSASYALLGPTLLLLVMAGVVR